MSRGGGDAVIFRSPRWDEVDYWALDLETSGLQPRRHQILSVGMVPLRNGSIEWGGHDYTLVRPELTDDLDRNALGVHQILPGELEGAPPLSEVMDRIHERLGSGAALIVHHAPFDVGFLKRAFRTIGMRWPRPPIVDTRLLVARVEERIQRLEPYAPPLPRSLTALCTMFGLPPFEAHHALGDALATAQLFLALRARLGAKTLRQLR
ncbi:MAG: PolC-type DNA polymerase III [Thermoanaerobaculia bacterium]